MPTASKARWCRLSRMMLVDGVQYVVHLEDDGFIGVKIKGSKEQVKFVHVSDLFKHLNEIAEPTTDRPAIIDKANEIPMPREQDKYT